MNASEAFIAKWADVCMASSNDGLEWKVVRGHGGGGIIQDADAILPGPGKPNVNNPP